MYTYSLLAVSSSEAGSDNYNTKTLFNKYHNNYNISYWNNTAICTFQYSFFVQFTHAFGFKSIFI